MNIAVIIIVIIIIIVVVIVVVIAVIIVIVIIIVANLVIFMLRQQNISHNIARRNRFDSAVNLSSFFFLFFFSFPTSPLPFSCFRASNTSRSTSLCEYPVCVYPGCDFVSVNRQAVALKVV